MVCSEKQLLLIAGSVMNHTISGGIQNKLEGKRVGRITNHVILCVGTGKLVNVCQEDYFGM